MNVELAPQVDRRSEAQRPHLDVLTKAILAIVCLCAGVAPTAVKWIANDVAKIAYSVLLTTCFLVFTRLASRESSLRKYADLSFAFFVLAFVQVLYDFSPYVGTYLLHEAPVTGNPMASTVWGTVAIQLYETFAAIVPVIALTKLSGRDVGSVYARKGKLGGWFVAALVAFVLFYVFTASHRSARIFPTNGTITLDRLLALTPALLVLVISNGFQEEFLLRGLFLQRYNFFFGEQAANVLQAAIFAIWHLGVTYTPAALIFIVVFVFPLGLFFGFLMRRTNGIVTPAIFHAGTDIPIYVAFLSYVP